MMLSNWKPHFCNKNAIYLQIKWNVIGMAQNWKDTPMWDRALDKLLISFSSILLDSCSINYLKPKNLKLERWLCKEEVWDRPIGHCPQLHAVHYCLQLCGPTIWKSPDPALLGRQMHCWCPGEMQTHCHWGNCLSLHLTLSLANLAQDSDPLYEVDLPPLSPTTCFSAKALFTPSSGSPLQLHAICVQGF